MGWNRQREGGGRGGMDRGKKGGRKREKEGGFLGRERERVTYEGKERKGEGRRKASMPDFNKVLKFTLLSVF